MATDEVNSSTDAVAEDDFSASFAEATGENVETGKAVEQPKTEDAVEAPVSETTEEPQGNAVNVEPTAQEDSPKTKVEEDVNYKELLEKERHKNRSWEGRITAEQRRNRELQQRIEELERTLKQSAPASTPTTPAIPEGNLVDVDDPLIKNFIEEMGEDFIKPLDAYMKKQLKPIIEEMIKPVIEKVPVLEQQVSVVNETVQQKHYQAIEEAHNDVVELIKPGPDGRSKIDEYIDNLPYREALKAKEIVQRGTTKQVIDFLTEFKIKTGIIKDNQTTIMKPTTVPKEKLNAATAVKGNISVVPKGKADPNDFYGAFREAIENSN